MFDPVQQHFTEFLFDTIDLVNVGESGRHRVWFVASPVRLRIASAKRSNLFHPAVLTSAGRRQLTIRPPSHPPSGTLAGNAMTAAVLGQIHR